uniref:Variant surface glycoprotein 1664 n=1 Tax=Trypanosoma brucei TaxID=5691 RepID=M4SZ02_9TRYP|nr:variant surface glycoprotein 1664 [Trypanosoma brucei]
MLARIQAVCALALATVAINHGAASSNAFNESGLTKLCNIATELQNAAGVANDWLLKVATAAEVATKVEHKLLIAVLVADNNSTTIVFSAAAREAQRCKATTLAAIKTAIPAAVANVATTAMGAGVITGLADMLQKMTDNANNRKCISSSPGTTSIKLGDPPKLVCQPYAITEPPGNRDFNSNKVKATCFTEFSAAQNSLVHTTDNNCSFLKNSASSVDDNWGNAATRLIGDLIAIQGRSGNAATANVAQADNIPQNFKVTGEANAIAKKDDDGSRCHPPSPTARMPRYRRTIARPRPKPRKPKNTPHDGSKRPQEANQRQRRTTNNGPNQ